MPMHVCRDCHHPEEVHNVNGRGECACGCTRLRPIDFEAREARNRQWIAEVRFFMKNRWVESGEFKVKALALGGATVTAVRQAKREHPNSADRRDHACEGRGDVAESRGAAV